MDLTWSTRIHVIVLHVMLVSVMSSKDVIRCDCNTQVCKETRKSMCVGVKSCYTELYHNELTRGCDPAPLACENQRPAGLDSSVEWPSLYCCTGKDLCNKYVIPSVPTTTPGPSDVSSDNKFKADKDNSSKCSNGSGAVSEKPRESSTKIINPIYIAVPVAGVCVLLALIIFAMYLLRRRTDYHHHDGFHHYHHEHAPAFSGHPQKKYVAPHHCQCICRKQTVMPSSCSKGNRCTDSERSSSGSETKLFIQT